MDAVVGELACKFDDLVHHLANTWASDAAANLEDDLEGHLAVANSVCSLVCDLVES